MVKVHHSKRQRRSVAHTLLGLWRKESFTGSRKNLLTIFTLRGFVNQFPKTICNAPGIACVLQLQ